MNKFLIALLPLAVIGFAAAAGVDKQTPSAEYGHKLLEAAKAIDSKDLARVDWLKKATLDSNNDWKHLELPKNMKFWSKEKDKTSLANLVRGVTVAIMYKTELGKGYPESGMTSKQVWMDTMDVKIIKPCENVVEQLEPIADAFEGLEVLSVKSKFGEDVVAWLNRFEMCERILYEPETYGDLSYDIAENNSLNIVTAFEI